MRGDRHTGVSISEDTRREYGVLGRKVVVQWGEGK